MCSNIEEIIVCLLLIAALLLTISTYVQFFKMMIIK